MLEIEKKYVLKDLPKCLGNGIKISQGYLSVDDPEVRIRQKGEKFYATLKGGAGLVREEIEKEISAEVFAILWPATEGKRIEKIRYEVKSPNGQTWEVDEYHGKLAGLVTVEVELQSETEQVSMPEAIKDLVVADVTTDKKYKNKNLAVSGI